MKLKITHSLVFTVFTFLFSYSQSQNTCYQDIETQRIYDEANPSEKQHLDQLRKQADTFALNYQDETLDRGTTNDLIIGTDYIIPVVVHIVENGGGASTITQLTVERSIEMLNRFFSGKSAYDPLIDSEFVAVRGAFSNKKIKFVLANFDPNGSPTSGVTFNNDPTYAAAGDLPGMRTLYNWPREKYFNIYVVDGFSNGIHSGFATFPFLVDNSPNLDAHVMQYWAFGEHDTCYQTWYHNLSHEVGHWLNLNHIWSYAFQSCELDDDVADTPNTDGNPYQDFNDYPGPGAIYTCGTKDNLTNMMDYTSPFYAMFTNGQRLRMEAALNSPLAQRNQLWQTSNVLETIYGCTTGLDSDSDGIPDACDVCPNDPGNDSDNDGICDSLDQCAGLPDVDLDAIPGVPDACDPNYPIINFNTNANTPYDASQDLGLSDVYDNGATIYITNNGWKAVDFVYNVTANTVLEFDFKSTIQGEAHFIGFDSDNQLPSTFQYMLHGRDAIANATTSTEYNTYPDTGEWVHYRIPIGADFTGTINKIFFSANSDTELYTIINALGYYNDGTSFYRNVKLYCGTILNMNADPICYECDVKTFGGGYPQGGVYSGAGVTDDGNGTTFSFDPAAAGVGTHAVSYNFNVGVGCLNTAIDDLVVYAPDVTFSAEDQCLNSGIHTGLGGGTPSPDSNPAIISTLKCTLDGITFTDGGTITGTFNYDPTTGDYSDWELTLSGGNTATFPNITYTPENSVVSSSSTSSVLSILLLPSISRKLDISFTSPLLISGGVFPVASGLDCFNCAPFRNLNAGSIIGVVTNSAIYSGPGVTDDGNGTTYTFDPIAAMVGNHTLTYTYTDIKGCTKTATTQMDVHNLTTPSFTAPAAICLNAGEQTGLSGGLPVSGVYSGPGITDDGNGMTFSFDPAVTGIGQHTITYTYGCTASDTFMVVPQPTVTFNALADLNIDEGIQSGLSGGSPNLINFFNQDFEAALTPFSGNWFLQNSNINAGNQAAQSEAILDNQSSSMIYTTTIPVGGAILSFSSAVSSEAGFDFLRFYINGIEQQSWSGNLSFQQHTFPLNEGTNILEWRYIKDQSVASFNDAAYVDDIIIDGVMVSGTSGVFSGAGVTDDGNGATYSFDPTVAGVGTHTLTYTYSDAFGCTNTATDDVIVIGRLKVGPKVYLQGASINPNAGEETLMRDDLRLANLLPTTSPYPDALICESSVFNTTGTNAIVDWVCVELRDETTNTIIIDSQSALLLRNGNIVALDGFSTLEFNQPDGNFFVSIKHRNHLGIMSASTVSLSSTITTVDFTDANNQTTFGANAQTSLGMPINIVGLWAGDVNSDKTVQYSGTSPDTPSILSHVLNDPGNFLNLPTYIFTGYHNNDVNMDGEIQYTGTTPDTPFLLQNVLSHYGNVLNLSTYTIEEQLPEN